MHKVPAEDKLDWFVMGINLIIYQKAQFAATIMQIAVFFKKRYAHFKMAGSLGSL